MDTSLVEHTSKFTDRYMGVAEKVPSSCVDNYEENTGCCVEDTIMVH